MHITGPWPIKKIESYESKNKGDFSMILYNNTLDGIRADHLKGFFVDWPNPPSTAKHYELLEKSSYIWLAVDPQTEDVVGFITAISDGVLAAYIPFLEVLPEYKERGIGKKLMTNMLSTLDKYYMIDLLCDENLQGYYEQFKMLKTQGMVIRNYQNQSGKEAVLKI